MTTTAIEGTFRQPPNENGFSTTDAIWFFLVIACASFFGFVAGFVFGFKHAARGLMQRIVEIEARANRLDALADDIRAQTALHIAGLKADDEPPEANTPS